jgi:hypothetical protein
MAQFWWRSELKLIDYYLVNLQKPISVQFVIKIFLFFLTGATLFGQNDSIKHRNDTLPDRFYIIQKVDRGGEKLPEIEIKEVNIVGHRKSFSRFQYWRYERLVYNVKRVYPYSVIVRNKIVEVNLELEKLPGDKERRDYIKKVEKNVFHDYEDDMRELTLTQGKLLIKLIDRETQNTSYDLIKDYRGRISAAFWQGIARIFGTNLKAEYDPYGEDAVIELIITEIENGRL